jgi:predicted HTH domain antitoxin
MTTITLDLPNDVFLATHLTKTELKIELAVHLFEQGKLSLGKASRLSGMNTWQFMQLIGSRGIAVHYDVAEYEEDLDTLRRLGRL